MMPGVELRMDALENWEWRYVVSSYFHIFLEIKWCKNIDFRATSKKHDYRRHGLRPFNKD